MGLMCIDCTPRPQQVEGKRSRPAWAAWDCLKATPTPARPYCQSPRAWNPMGQTVTLTTTSVPEQRSWPCFQKPSVYRNNVSLTKMPASFCFRIYSYKVNVIRQEDSDHEQEWSMQRGLTPYRSIFLFVRPCPLFLRLLFTLKSVFSLYYATTSIKYHLKETIVLLFIYVLFMCVLDFGWFEILEAESILSQSLIELRLD